MMRSITTIKYLPELKAYIKTKTYNTDAMNRVPEKYRVLSGYRSCRNFRPGCSILYTLNLALLVFTLTSCEKAIEVDLNDSEPVIVIEGNLSYERGELEVKLSKSGSYFDSAPYEKVNGADVVLDGGPGYRLTAEETGDGIYRLDGLPLNAGNVYRLNVVAGGEEYTSVSELNPEVKIDSVG